MNALPDELARSAEVGRVARATGVDFEMDLPFEGLHQLILPFLEGVEWLCRPQSGAIEAEKRSASWTSPTERASLVCSPARCQSPPRHATGCRGPRPGTGCRSDGPALRHQLSGADHVGGAICRHRR
jgi:hypothetical protein